LVYFMAIWYILWPFGIFYGELVNFIAICSSLRTFGNFMAILVHFVVIWYSFPVLVFCTKKIHAQKTAFSDVARARSGPGPSPAGPWVMAYTQGPEPEHKSDYTHA
jgi:hypothetical protein